MSESAPSYTANLQAMSWEKLSKLDYEDTKNYIKLSTVNLLFHVDLFMYATDVNLWVFTGM